MSKILVIRLSSFGDVAMLVPVIYSVAARYPHDKFTVLTRTAFLPLFENLGFNVNAMPFDPKRHNSIWGFSRLLKRINTLGFSYVVDEHDVLRTKVIRTCLWLRGKHVEHINKDKAKKNKAIASKELEPALKPNIERYLDVFDRIGFHAEMSFTNFFEFTNRDFYQLRSIATEKTGRWIGIAPFSKHEEKVYPLDKMENLIKRLSANPNNRIFLFGASKNEDGILDDWTNKYPNTTNVIGKLSLVNELLLMSYLDVMVSMDSANMHLASLVQTPVVSIWGATHPNIGFYGHGQDLDLAVQTEIECRPCSVYGEIACARGDLACLTRINETTIIDKIESVLAKKGL